MRRKPISYRRGYEQPDGSPNPIQPRELSFGTDAATVTVEGVTVSTVDGKKVYELSNRSGIDAIRVTTEGGPVGRITSHAQLYRRVVRARHSGEILGIYDNVYDWNEWSVTLLSRGTLVENGVTYPLNQNVGTLDGSGSDVIDGKGPVNRATVIRYPFPIEVYDPDETGIG